MWLEFKWAEDAKSVWGEGKEGRERNQDLLPLGLPDPFSSPTSFA